jgi:hypothetical protein
MRLTGRWQLPDWRWTTVAGDLCGETVGEGVRSEVVLSAFTWA